MSIGKGSAWTNSDINPNPDKRTLRMLVFNTSPIFKVIFIRHECKKLIKIAFVNNDVNKSPSLKPPGILIVG